MVLDNLQLTHPDSVFRMSGLWRDGWTFARAVQTSAVYIGLRATVKALRGKEQQQHGKPAPEQQALELEKAL